MAWHLGGLIVARLSGSSGHGPDPHTPTLVTARQLSSSKYKYWHKYE